MTEDTGQDVEERSWNAHAPHRGSIPCGIRLLTFETDLTTYAVIYDPSPYQALALTTPTAGVGRPLKANVHGVQLSVATFGAAVVSAIPHWGRRLDSV